MIHDPLMIAVLGKHARQIGIHNTELICGVVRPLFFKTRKQSYNFPKDTGRFGRCARTRAESRQAHN